jgi:hypothetical protein
MTTTSRWRKSSYSGADNACVEVLVTPVGTGVRDSKRPDAGELSLGWDAARAFLADVCSNEWPQR